MAMKAAVALVNELCRSRDGDSCWFSLNISGMEGGRLQVATSARTLDRGTAGNWGLGSRSR